MPGGTDWASIVVAIVGAAGVGTVVGSAITTYGGRRQARQEIHSKALECLENFEVQRRAMTPEEAQIEELVSSTAVFRSLLVACMIAGVPRHVIDTYGSICDQDPWLGTAGHAAEVDALSFTCQRTRQDPCRRT
jgi:hypothetical protein